MDRKAIAYVKFFADLCRTDVYARRIGNRYEPVREKLIQLTIERHVGEGPPIGSYLLEGAKTRVGVLDLDSHDGLTDWAEMIASALAILTVASSLGLRAHVFRSGGGHGVHVWFVWDKPQNARYVRHLLRNLLASVGYKDGSSGVANREIEVFPKQDCVAPDGFGNLIALPGARRSELLDPVSGEPVAWETLDLADVTTRWSDPVPEVPEEEQRHAAFQQLPGDLDEAVAALRVVAADDYHVWLRVALALKAAFGDDGESPFDMWSQKSTKYPGPDKITAFWRGLKPNGQVGVGTIFYLAREAGWNGPSHPLVREMNARFGIYTNGRLTQIIVKDGDGRPEADFVFLSKASFIDRLAPEAVTAADESGETHKTSKAKLWLEHRLADHYYNIDFDPSRPSGHNGRTWNLWTGFGVEPVAGDWSLLKAHIRENICGGDEEKYRWMMNWMALGVQDRGRPIGTVPVLIGAPGTGKGVLAHAYGRLWGRHYVTVTHPEHVFGRFSSHLMGRRFVFIDEGTFGGNRKEAGLLKTRVTEPVLMFEQKGVDPIKMYNRLIFMIASNELSVVPADLNDRRWMVIEVGDAHREDHAYFGAIMSQLESGGYEAMLYELLHRDVGVGPDSRRVIKSAALFEQILYAQGPDIAYIHMILDQGRLPQNWLNGASVTTIKALFFDLRHRLPHARYITDITLGRRLRKVFPNIPTAPNGRYLVKVGEIEPIYEQSVRYAFPPLSEARRQFERFVGMPQIEWSADVIEWQLDPGQEGDDDDVPF